MPSKAKVRANGIRREDKHCLMVHIIAPNAAEGIAGGNIVINDYCNFKENII